MAERVGFEPPPLPLPSVTCRFQKTDVTGNATHAVAHCPLLPAGSAVQNPRWDAASITESLFPSENRS